MLRLALFDLDNTLLGGDSDYLWGQFLGENGLVDGAAYEQENRRYYEEYCAGTLDIHAFLTFSLRPLSQYPIAELEQWRSRFVADKIEPIILPKGLALLDRHRQQDHTLLIVTATNRFVTDPIARRLAVPHLLATEPEQVDGRYTGRISGTPCFRAGKVERLQAWLAQHEATATETWFYSDSHNDIPLLEYVDHPIAVDPDASLQAHAQAQGWPIISLRGASSPAQT